MGRHLIAVTPRDWARIRGLLPIATAAPTLGAPASCRPRREAPSLSFAANRLCATRGTNSPPCGGGPARCRRSGPRLRRDRREYSLWLPRSRVGASAGAPRPLPEPDAERPHGIPTLERGNEKTREPAVTRKAAPHWGAALPGRSPVTSPATARSHAPRGNASGTLRVPSSPVRIRRRLCAFATAPGSQSMRLTEEDEATAMLESHRGLDQNSGHGSVGRPSGRPRRPRSA